jgi:hypothetical protein
MAEAGYCLPHSCKRCQQILVDMSERSVSTRLKPFHQRIESWPVKARYVIPDSFLGSHELASTLRGQPPFVRPFNIGSIRINHGRLKTVRRLLFWYEKVAWVASGCPSINKRVTSAFCKDAVMANRANYNLQGISCYNISRKKLDRNAAAGCLFFQTLANAISASLAGDPPLQDPEFVLASRSMHIDTLEFGLINYGISSRTFDLSPLFKADIIVDDGMQYFIKISPRFSFTIVPPNGHLHLLTKVL